MNVHNGRQNEVNCSIKIPCLERSSAKAVGARAVVSGCSGQAWEEHTHTLEDLIASFQSICLFAIAVIVPNIYLVSMTEVPLDKVRAAGLVIGSNELSVFSDRRASPWPFTCWKES